jgi:predicted MPP superfamily phosphohydrolase
MKKFSPNTFGSYGCNLELKFRVISSGVAQYVYAQWAGLYENIGRYVYVNRGFGFHAYPGRVGIMPEITVIELKKGDKVA